MTDVEQDYGDDDVNQLLKQFKEVQKMMKMFGKAPKGKGKKAKVPILPGM